jgi:hypothetical protein
MHYFLTKVGVMLFEEFYLGALAGTNVTKKYVGLRIHTTPYYHTKRAAPKAPLF